MPKVRFTKNEMKKQKDALKMYQRYLPTLVLKKQQLQMEIQKVEHKEAGVRLEKESMEDSMRPWIAVWGEGPTWENCFPRIHEKNIGEENIAGVSIPVLENVVFSPVEYDLWITPPWIESAIDFLQKIIHINVKLQILEEQRKRLAQELRITTQRVNLFEKVKIPETKNNIKKISIYLGDQRTAAVVQGKISKRNLERVVS